MSAGRSSDSRGIGAIRFRSGGWVLALAVILVAGVVTWRVLSLVRTRGSHAIGDGKDPATYGFDLSTCLVPLDTLVAANIPKDGIPALVDPPTITPADVDAINEAERGKYLVPHDRVIGVTLDGESRAYPIRVLNWHEIANDTVAGRPIAVTYNPLCDSVVVFDRRTEGQTLTFGVSGLLYNSNLLMYDRRPGGSGESLWCQLQGRAVAGPAAESGARLQIVAASVVHWGEWCKEHPQTRVLGRDAALADRYRRDPYASYFGSDQLRFPVSPLPPRDGPAWKTPVIVLGIGESRRVFALSTVAERAGANGRWKTDLGGEPIEFTYASDPATASVRAVDSATELEVMYAFWFAWYAMHPHEAALAMKD